MATVIATLAEFWPWVLAALAGLAGFAVGMRKLLDYLYPSDSSLYFGGDNDR